MEGPGLGRGRVRREDPYPVHSPRSPQRGRPEAGRPSVRSTTAATLARRTNHSRSPTRPGHRGPYPSSRPNKAHRQSAGEPKALRIDDWYTAVHRRRGGQHGIQPYVGIVGLRTICTRTAPSHATCRTATGAVDAVTRCGPAPTVVRSKGT